MSKRIYYAGLDLAQQQDYTALTIARKVTTWLPVHDKQGRQKSVNVYHAGHLERLQGVSYFVQVRHVAAVLGALPPQQTTLVIDATGVGRAVCDLFTEARLPYPLVFVTIHGGSAVTRDGNEWHVPKRDLIATAQVLLQSQRLKIVASLPAAALLVQELQQYRVKLDPISAHDSYNARAGAHDDLVLSLCLSCWAGEHCQPPAMGRKLLNGY